MSCNQKTYFFLKCIIISVIIFNCSNNNITSGGLDTGNSIVTGILISENSTIIPNGIVSLLPATYNPATDSNTVIPLNDTTNNLGQFEISVSKKGHYTLYAINPQNGQNKLIFSIDISSEKVSMNNICVSTPGTIQLSLEDFKNNTPLYFYIPGSNIIAAPDKSGNAFLLNVPSGTVDLLKMVDSTNNDTIIGENVSVNPNQTTYHPFFKILLLVGGDTTTALTTNIKRQRQIMIDSGATVITKDFNTFSFSSFDTSDINLIYCAHNINWDSINNTNFITAKIPIAVTSGKGYSYLGMTDTTNGSFGTDIPQYLLSPNENIHAILKGLDTNSIVSAHTYENGNAPWGIPYVTAEDVLVGNSDQQKEFIFIYKSNYQMVNAIAPDVRIGLFSGEVWVTESPDFGTTIFWRTLLYGAGKFNY